MGGNLFIGEIKLGIIFIFETNGDHFSELDYTPNCAFQSNISDMCKYKIPERLKHQFVTSSLLPY